MLKKSQHGFSAHLLLPVVAILAVIGIGGFLAKHYYEHWPATQRIYDCKSRSDHAG
jgi:hypothetical protein